MPEELLCSSLQTRERTFCRWLKGCELFHSQDSSGPLGSFTQVGGWLCCLGYVCSTSYNDWNFFVVDQMKELVWTEIPVLCYSRLTVWVFDSCFGPPWGGGAQWRMGRWQGCWQCCHHVLCRSAIRRLSEGVLFTLVEVPPWHEVHSQGHIKDP